MSVLGCTRALQLPLLAAALLIGTAAGAAAQDYQGENILLIVADDVGVDQIGIYGEGTDLPQTPFIDGLANDGVLFRNAWSNPLSSPARAALLTGRYAFRTGIGASVFPTNNDFALQLDEVILPEMLQQLTDGAYATGAFGKWFLGNSTVGGPLAPNLAGFDHFAGTEDNLSDYYLWPRVVNGNEEMCDVYATSQVVDDALDWISTAPEPWFCYLSFHSGHTPIHFPPESLHSEDTGQDDFRSKYKAMVQAMDTEIGRMLGDLGPTLDRTTIIFLGDNGTSKLVLPPETPQWQSKFTLYEGGVNVPLIVSGPPVAMPGSECEALVSLTDVFATMAELVSRSPGPVVQRETRFQPPSDSVSMVPYLSNPSTPSIRQWVYAERFNDNGFGSYFQKAMTIRTPKYKLLISEGFDFHPEPIAMFDMRLDKWEEGNMLLLPTLPPQAQKVYNRLQRVLNWLHRQR